MNYFLRPPRKSELLPDDLYGSAVTFPIPMRGGLEYIGIIMSNGNSPLSLRRFRNLRKLVRNFFDI